MGDSRLGQMARELLDMGQDDLRDIPAEVHTLAGTFTVVTDRNIIDVFLEQTDDGGLWYHEGTILIDGNQKRNRSRWEILIHELVHVADKTLTVGLSEENVQQIASFLTDFLERNGMLDRRDDDGETG